MRRFLLAVAALTTVLAAQVPAVPAATGGVSVPCHRFGTWSALADFPQERTEVSAVALDGVIYAAGGLTPDPAIPGDTLYAYRPGPDTWEELAPVPHERVHHAPLTAYDGSVYLVGGYALLPTDTLLVYDVASDTWREGPPLPEPLAAHAVATTPDGTIHVVGGVDRDLAVSDRHYAFDTATGTWSTLPPMPTAREHLGAAYLHGRIYIAAGRGGDSDGNELEVYDLKRRIWKRLPDLPTPRSGVAMVAFRGQVYVLGGESFEPDRTFDEVERFHPHRRTWTAVAPLPTTRHGLGGAVLRDGIVVVAGGPGAGFTFSSDVEIWRPGRAASWGRGSG